MKFKFVFLILLGISSKTISQKPALRIDSLKQELIEVREDSASTKLYISLAAAYYSKKPDSFFIYCHKGIETAKKWKQRQYLATLDLKMSSMLTDTGNYKLSLQYAEESVQIAKELGSKTGIIDGYNTIGNCYDYQSDFVKSSDYFFRAMALAQELKDHGRIALMGTTLAAVYFNQGNFKQSEKYALYTIQESMIAKTPVHLYKGYYILGLTDASLKDTSLAQNYFRKAIEVCKNNGFLLNEAEVLNDLAVYQRDDQETLNVLLQSRKIFDTLNPGSFNSRVNWQALGEVYIKLYKATPDKKAYLTRAAEYLNKAVSKSREANDLLPYSRGLEYLAVVEDLKGNGHQAYNFLLQSKQINDSVFSQENKNKIAALESRNMLDKKNQEIETQKLKVKEQQKNMFILFGGLLLMSGIGVLFYRLSVIRKHKNKALTKLNEELEEANNLKTKFFGILSHDLRSPIANLVNFLNLRKMKPGAMSTAQLEEREARIGASAQSLLETMDCMLLWSKGQMQHFRPENTKVPVAELFSHLQKLFEGYKNISLEFFNESDMFITTDENYMKTIMYNLTANAIKSLKDSPHGIVAWKAWKENELLFLSIKDNGPGVDQGKLKALYDVTASTGAKHGLGLHIIRDLAKAIKYKVQVHSAYGKGTEFVLAP
jgi:signal transduction histidine kinase